MNKKEKKKEPDGVWIPVLQARGCCQSTVSKGASIREFLRGNSCAGKEAALLFVQNAFLVQVTT